MRIVSTSAHTLCRCASDLREHCAAQRPLNAPSIHMSLFSSVRFIPSLLQQFGGSNLQRKQYGKSARHDFLASEMHGNWRNLRGVLLDRRELDVLPERDGAGAAEEGDQADAGIRGVLLVSFYRLIRPHLRLKLRTIFSIDRPDYNCRNLSPNVYLYWALLCVRLQMR